MSEPAGGPAEHLAEAALQVPAARRAAFLDEACGGDAVLRREVDALVNRHARLSALPPDTRQRVSGLFHAALGLAADRRARYLDVACGEEPAVRQEVNELLACAEDPAFLETVALPPSGAATRHVTPHVSDPHLGAQVRDYLILRKLGEGGMGVVYLALDTKLDKRVAAKAVRPEYAGSPEYRRRLVSEAKLAAQLSHQNVATVFALVEDDDEVFIVSEYVDGPSLRQEMDRGLIAYPRLLDIFTAVAHGLAAAHGRGIVHRDLKPDNILLTAEGDPKIVDFGLAKSHRALLSSTRATLAGTPAYMAPEQTEERPARPIDFRADIFSFGVTLHEAITGRNPFEGATLLTTLDNILHRDPPAPERPGTDLGPLGRIVRRCLEKLPEARYGSTRELVADLERLRTAPALAPAGSGRAASGQAAWSSSAAPRRAAAWWEVHQLGTTAFYAGTLILAWVVHSLARPASAGRALALLAVLTGSALGAVRLHFWFASRQGLTKLAESSARFGPWVRRGDALLGAILFGLTAVFLYGDRPNTAVVFAILGVVTLVLAFVIEPAAKADAFPEDRR